MPAVFDKRGICFEYPDNWSVDELCDDDDPQVVVSSPETAFWHLSKYPAGTDLEGLFDKALAAMRAEYREMEVSPVGDRPDDDQPVDDRPEACRLNGFDVNFYCLDLTSTAWLRGFQTDEATFLLLCQAEDRELQSVGPVFRAMWTSLLRDQPQRDGPHTIAGDTP